MAIESAWEPGISGAHAHLKLEETRHSQDRAHV